MRGWPGSETVTLVAGAMGLVRQSLARGAGAPAPTAGGVSSVGLGAPCRCWRGGVTPRAGRGDRRGSTRGSTLLNEACTGPAGRGKNQPHKAGGRGEQLRQWGGRGQVARPPGSGRGDTGRREQEGCRENTEAATKQQREGHVPASACQNKSTARGPRLSHMCRAGTRINPQGGDHA